MCKQEKLIYAAPGADSAQRPITATWSSVMVLNISTAHKDLSYTTA